MCGIFGTTKKYDESLLNSKLEVMKFRGPDFSQHKIIDGGVCTFGHNRLAIIDLDSRSNQPFEYQNYTIVFNGEIYNFLELKQKLHARGYVFNTLSDTEVICAAYAEYGQNCLKYLNGMFAFVIYDRSKQELFGARDRLGKKPFYYLYQNGHFEFASQLNSIKLGNDANLTINHESISSFLAWKYIPDPQSIYREVSKLEPGHFFIFSLHSRALSIKKYWDFDLDTTIIKNKTTYEEEKYQLHELIKDSVAKRMISDVPLGVFLSGGIDSSLVAAVASKQSNQKISTFSIGFEEDAYDESQYAQKVASHLETNHHTFMCTFKDCLSLLENYNHYYDEPFSDSSAIPSMLLSSHTKRHVTVALSGDGGDEMFQGYKRYDWINKASFAFYFPEKIRKLMGQLLQIMPINKKKQLRQLLECKDIYTVYKYLMTNFSIHDVLFNADKIMNTPFDSIFESNVDLLNKVSYFDLKTYLNGDINTKVDRASMAFSLEVRGPLMDYRIAEKAFSMKSDYKFGKGEQKRILKEILYEYVPKNYFERPKSGFAIPLKSWLRNELKEMVVDYINNDALKVIEGLNTTMCISLRDSHLKREKDNSAILWSLIVLSKFINEN